jgi:DNA-binding transcriptional ArsR family regulator
MIRLPSFDQLNSKRLAILKILVGRELDEGEIVLLLPGSNRQRVRYSLKCLFKAGLVSCKPALKNGKKKPVKRWFLSQDGQQCLAYFCGERFLP